MPIFHGISHQHYAMHATQLFIDRSIVPQAWGTFDRKSTLFELIANFFSEERCYRVLTWYCVYRVAL